MVKCAMKTASRSWEIKITYQIRRGLKMWTWCPFLQSFNKLGKSTEWSNSSSFSFFPSPGPFPPAWQRSPSLKVHIEPHGSFRQVYHQEQHTDANNTLDRQHEVMRRKNMLLIARFGMLELYWPCRSIHINVNSCVCVYTCSGVAWVYSCSGMEALEGFPLFKVVHTAVWTDMHQLC